MAPATINEENNELHKISWPQWMMDRPPSAGFTANQEGERLDLYRGGTEDSCLPFESLFLDQTANYG